MRVATRAIPPFDGLKFFPETAKFRVKYRMSLRK